MRLFLVTLSVLFCAEGGLADEVVARINFQPAGAAVPTDYAVDSGQLFSTTRGYGWDGATQQKVRGGIADERLATYVSVKNGSTHEWELALENGDYKVTLVCGSPVFRGLHRVSIEGTLVIDDEATFQSHIDVVDHPVTITDGRLTIEAGIPGSSGKTKLQYIIVTSDSGGGTPPPPPPPANTPPTVSTTASTTSGEAPLEVTFTTTANDAEGPIASTDWTFGDGGTSAALNPTHTYTDAGTYTAKIVVTDEGGLTAEATVTITVDEPAAPPPPPPPPPAPTGGELRFNFQPPGPAPSGYVADTGEQFTAARGHGWSSGATNIKRNFHDEELRDTYCFVKNGSPQTWEVALANGGYEVTLVCGSPQWSGIHTAQVEGTTVISGVKTGSSEFVEVLRHPVTVSDGRLTIKLGGSSSGKKSKLCYLIVHGAGGADPGEPVGEPPTVTATGTPLTGDAPLSVSFTGTGADQDGSIDSYAWSFGDGDTSAVQNPTHIYDTPGTYAATVTVADDQGNTTQATLTIEVTGDPPAPPPPPGLVTASVETPPVQSSLDAADDPAVWVHPDDPGLSVVLGTDKTSGALHGYDLQGNELWRLPNSGNPNNVDVRGNIVACSLNATHKVAVFLMDPGTRTLISQGEFDVGVEAYGFTLYVSPVSGKLYCFVTGRRLDAEQWEIELDPLAATLVREFDTAKAEGVVADDETGKLFLAEENTGLYVYDAEPTGGQTRTKIQGAASSILTGEIEGLTIYYAANGKGYVIASDQGPDRFVVFNRTAPYAHVATFQVKSHPDAPAPGAHDGVSETDGIHVLNLALGDDFPHGIFIAQDGSNTKPSENQNFKYVPWERIADLLGLEKDTTFVPGGNG